MSVGMFMGNLAECERWYKEGMNIFWTMSEDGCMRLGLKSFADKIGEL